MILITNIPQYRVEELTNPHDPNLPSHAIDLTIEEMLDELNISDLSPEELCILIEDMQDDKEYTREEILLFISDYLGN